MIHTPVTHNLLIGYAPMFGRWRELCGLRLQLLPFSPGGPVGTGPLLEMLYQAFAVPVHRQVEAAADPAHVFPSVPVLLDGVGVPLAQGLLQADLPPWVGLALPVEMMVDASLRRSLHERRASGAWLVARARSFSQFRDFGEGVFTDLLIDADDITAEPDLFAAPTWVEGIDRLAGVEKAFESGARGVIGWPLETEPGPARDIRAEVPVLVDLMNRVERLEPISSLEQVLKADPTLVFRLLRHLNSVAFGLKVEVTALQQALMLLGYLPLLRWLSRMLIDAAATEGASRSLVHLSVRRGFLMEELASVGNPTAPAAGLASEMFLCGMFSLLGVILRRPLGELLPSLPLPERVICSLLEPDGPYSLHLRWVEAVESGSVAAIRTALEGLRIAPAESNQALLRGLGAARSIDG